LEVPPGNSSVSLNEGCTRRRGRSSIDEELNLDEDHEYLESVLLKVKETVETEHPLDLVLETVIQGLDLEFSEEWEMVLGEARELQHSLKRTMDIACKTPSYPPSVPPRQVPIVNGRKNIPGKRTRQTG